MMTKQHFNYSTISFITRYMQSGVPFIIFFVWVIIKNCFMQKRFISRDNILIIYLFRFRTYVIRFKICTKCFLLFFFFFFFYTIFFLLSSRKVFRGYFVVYSPYKNTRLRSNYCCIFWL